MEKKAILDNFEKAELIVDKTEIFLKKIKKLIYTLVGIFFSLWISFSTQEGKLKKEEIILLNDARNKIIEQVNIQDERITNLEKEKVAHLDLAKMLIAAEYKKAIGPRVQSLNGANVKQIEDYLYSGILKDEKDYIEKAALVVAIYKKNNFKK